MAEDDQVPDSQDNSPQNNTLQLGFVELLEPAIDPVFNSLHPSHSMPADFYRLWSKHFNSPASSNTVHISPNWAAFFTASLMNPCSFEWAKKFLTSPAWDLISPPKASSFHFMLPAKCPTEFSSSCLVGDGQSTINFIEDIFEATEDLCDAPDSPLNQQEDDINISPSKGPWSVELLQKAGKLKISEADPGLRRSGRVQANNKGFKGKSCADNNCIACSSDPPVFSPSIIKNLGISFCNVDPEHLSESALLKKEKPSAPGEKKKNHLKIMWISPQGRSQRSRVDHLLSLLCLASYLLENSFFMWNLVIRYISSISLLSLLLECIIRMLYRSSPMVFINEFTTI